MNLPIMKKTTLTLSAVCLALVAGIFQNCNKNKTTIATPSAREEKTSTAPQARNSGISLYYDILEFESGEILNQTLDLINGNSEKYNSSYIEVNLGKQSLDSIPPDSLEKFDLKMNKELNVYLAYEEFVKTMEFQALVSEFIPLQKDWMKNGGDDTKDPFLKYPYPLAFQSVLNKYHEVKIETTIYKFDVASESVFEITDGDYKTVLALRKDPGAAGSRSNVTVYAKSSSCKTFKNDNAKKDYVRDGKNFKFKSYSGIASSYVNAITQNFRKHKSGALLWSGCKMSNTITADAVYNNGRCDTDMRTATGVNGSNNAFRLEKLAFVLFYNPETYKLYQGMNLHCPSHKTRTTSQIYSPYDYLTVYAW